jgi:hypothetical protein
VRFLLCTQFCLGRLAKTGRGLEWIKEISHISTAVLGKANPQDFNIGDMLL